MGDDLIAVLGGGTMRSGIAQVALAAGLSVVLYDFSPSVSILRHASWRSTCGVQIAS
jgi:3-hydroxyacyl-CoA dehydrogenase